MRVLLVDDHPLFAEGLQNLLVARGVEVVGTARDGWEALEKARALRPDVILMDVHMPGCDGLQATRVIKAEMPEIKVVMLTVSETDQDLFEAVKAGASGYLLKSLNADAFFRLLSDLVRGEAALSPGMASRVLEAYREASAELAQIEDSLQGLSPRQVEVLSLVAQGLTYKEVGAELSLSERTIKYHMAQILEQLHLESRAQAIAWAARHGLGRKH